MEVSDPKCPYYFQWQLSCCLNIIKSKCGFLFSWCFMKVFIIHIVYIPATFEFYPGLLQKLSNVFLFPFKKELPILINLKFLVAFTCLVIWSPGFVFCGESTTSVLTFWDPLNGHREIGKDSSGTSDEHSHCLNMCHAAVSLIYVFSMVCRVLNEIWRGLSVKGKKTSSQVGVVTWLPLPTFPVILLFLCKIP